MSEITLYTITNTNAIPTALGKSEAHTQSINTTITNKAIVESVAAIAFNNGLAFIGLLV